MDSIFKWVLIAVIYVVYTAIKGGFAKSKEIVVPDQDGDDVEVDQMPMPMKPVMGGVPRKRKPVHNIEVPKTPDHIMEKVAKRRTEKRVEKRAEEKKTPINEHINNIETQEVDHSSNEEFDLKQAFIYSEILKTKF